jgi:hypothetical protein
LSISIFLSYARSDDEPFVSRLHADLTSCGFDVWWDRISMPARGLTFLHEIRDAIDARDRFLLVLGPAATTSDYVVSEWQHAVSYGNAINPILRLADFSLVPDELKLLHVEDFRDDSRYSFHFENLVRQLSAPVSPMGKLFAVPSLPRHTLARRDSLQSLKVNLLDDIQRPIVVTGAAARMGVYGMGGIGKSVLVNLLARDSEVRRAFPDGVLWIVFGIAPNILELQRNVLNIFLDSESIENVAQGRVKLESFLASRAVLLVLDDVWDRAHAEAFNVLGPRCRAIITTRDAGLVKSLDGKHHQLELLTAAESLDLLAGKTGVSLDRLPLEANEIVSECGCLPLAVALCGGMIRRGVSWTNVLQRLKKAALESVADRNAENILHRNIWTAMKVSVDALAPEERERFVELSVFPSSETVPEAAVNAVWSHSGDLDEFAREDLFLSLSERSLIRLDTQIRAGQVPGRRVSLHDLLHDFATRLAGDAIRLHRLLLDAYRKTCLTIGQWHTIPADGYIHGRLGWHLEQAKDIRGLHSLLSEETADGHNGWFEANERLGQPRNVEEDVARAWNLAAQGAVGSKTTETLGMQCRFALISASLNSLRGNVPAVLQQALVRYGLWSVQQALTCARRTPDEEQKPSAFSGLVPFLAPSEVMPVLREALMAVSAISAEVRRSTALQALLPCLPAELISETLQIVRTIGYQGSRCRLLVALAESLPEQERTALIAEALTVARSWNDKMPRAYMLARILRILPEEERPAVVSEARELVRSIWEEEPLAYALTALASMLPEQERLSTYASALEAARGAARSYYYGGGSTVYRAGALVELAPLLPSELIPKALGAARTIKDDRYLAQFLVGLAARLPSDSIAESIQIARSIVDRENHSIALEALAVRVSKSERSAVFAEALSVACEIEGDKERSRRLASLVPRLPLQLMSQTLTSARTIVDAADRSDVLAAVATRLSKHERHIVFAEAVEAARAIREPSSRSTGLVALVARFPEYQPHALLAEARTAAHAIQGGKSRALTLFALARELPEEERPIVISEALAVVRVIGDEEVRSQALLTLAAYLPEQVRLSVLSDALSSARPIQEHRRRCDILIELAERFPKDERSSLLGEALAAARCIGDPQHRLKALAALAAQMGEDSHSDVLADALATARSIGDPAYRSRTLAALAPQMLEHDRSCVVAEALTAARMITDEYDRGYALSALAAQLPEQDHPGVVNEALTAACAVGNEEFRQYALIRIVPLLPPELIAKALQAAQAFEHKDYGNEVLAVLAPRLSRGLLVQAMAAARSMQITIYRSAALATLASSLPESKRSAVISEALRAALTIRNQRNWSKKFSEILAALAPQLKPKLLERAVNAVRSIRDDENRCRAFLALIPSLPTEERAGMLSEALEAAGLVQNDSDRYKLLEAMAPHLPPELVPKAITAARAINSANDRSWALLALAPHLPAPERVVVLSDAFSSARVGLSDHSAFLVALAPQLPPALLSEALTVACGLERQTRQSHDDHPSALGALVRRLATLSSDEISDLWMIPMLAANSRSRLLVEICRLAPVLAIRAGQDVPTVLRNVAKAITDVARWWP